MPKYQNDLTINAFTIKIESLLQLNYNTDFNHTAQKMKFSIKGFLSKCDQIRSFLRIWSHLLQKSFMENFLFCAVTCLYQSFLIITL